MRESLPFSNSSRENPHFDNLAGSDATQCGESLRHVRPNVIEIVRSRTDDQNSDISARDVLLIADILVNGDEDVKLLLSQGNQLAILFAAESRISNRLALVPTLGKKDFVLRGKHSSRSNLILELLPG